MVFKKNYSFLYIINVLWKCNIKNIEHSQTWSIYDWIAWKLDVPHTFQVSCTLDSKLLMISRIHSNGFIGNLSMIIRPSKYIDHFLAKIPFYISTFIHIRWHVKDLITFLQDFLKIYSLPRFYENVAHTCCLAFRAKLLLP